MSAPHGYSPDVIDMRHLERQTMGDAALRHEILGLLLGQVREIGPRLEAAAVEERYALAHALKGAARGCGAFVMADAAQALEASPHDADAVRALRQAMNAVASLIEGLPAVG